MAQTSQPPLYGHSKSVEEAFNRKVRREKPPRTLNEAFDFVILSVLCGFPSANSAVKSFFAESLRSEI